MKVRTRLHNSRRRCSGIGRAGSGCSRVLAARSGVGSWRQRRCDVALRSQCYCGGRMVAVAHSPHRAPRSASSAAQRARVWCWCGRCSPTTTIRSSGASSSYRELSPSARGLWWLSPRVSWYVGLSGVLHTIMGAGCARHLAVRAWDRWILIGVSRRQSSLMSSSAATSRRWWWWMPISTEPRADSWSGLLLSWRVAIIRLRSRAAGPSRG